MKYLFNLIKDQIYNLNNLAHNYLDDVKLLDREEVFELLEYMHKNYLPIHQYERIIQNDIEMYKVFELCYQLYVIDFINEIIPYLRDRDVNISCSTLVDLKENLLQFARTRVDNSIMLSLEPEKIKYLFYMDLFDSDLEDFCVNYLLPVMSKITY